MKKDELLTAIATEAGVTKADANRCLQALTNVIVEQLKGREKVALSGLGTFEARYRKERDGRNPSTGETVKIAAAYVPAFKASSALKKEIK